MATCDVTALQRSDLNEFLFADVGTEASGMVLSVVSLFARQGNDPWREADRLADLPKAGAADSLAHSIADMPQGRWNLPDAAAIAARLIGLLPARPARTERRLAAGAGVWGVWVPSSRNLIVLACVALGIVYAVTALLRPAPARVDGGDVASFMAAPAPGSAPRIGAPGPGAPGPR